MCDFILFYIIKEKKFVWIEWIGAGGGGEGMEKWGWLKITRLNRFVERNEKETERMRMIANHFYSFILFPSHIERIGRERKRF